MRQTELNLSGEDRSTHAQKNDLKPWRRVMWCIGTLTDEYRARMYALFELYARSKSKTETSFASAKRA
jgi:hypothetical protein